MFIIRKNYYKNLKELFIGIIKKDIGGGSVFYCSGTDYLHTRCCFSDSIFSK